MEGKGPSESAEGGDTQLPCLGQAALLDQLELASHTQPSLLPKCFSAKFSNKVTSICICENLPQTKLIVAILGYLIVKLVFRLSPGSGDQSQLLSPPMTS